MFDATQKQSPPNGEMGALMSLKNKHIKQKTCFGGLLVLCHLDLGLIMYLSNSTNLQGDPKKMSHSVLQLKSVVGVQSYFFRGVSESEFRARSN